MRCGGIPDAVPGWMGKQVEREVSKDTLPLSERIGQLIVIPFTVLGLWFFSEHQSRPTGFFTDGFGTVEAALFYGSIAVGLVPPVARFLIGRKNPVRVVDVVQMIFFVVAGAYLLGSFPFDFTYFAHVLPSSIQPAVDWITDGIAKFVMGIALVAGVVSIPYTIMLYHHVKRRLLVRTL